jgi:chemotaxis protein CheD
MGSVRMGEMLASSSSGDELVAIGLGSCIGLALVDRSAGVAGLAHVVLPDSGGTAGPAAKFADLAVPALLEKVTGLGAHKERLEAVLVGGAKMFALGSGMDIGARNEAAVRDALSDLRVKVRATATGGSSGRTMKVFAGDCTVNVHEAGGKPETLLGKGGSGAGATTRRAGGMGFGLAGASA